MLKWNTDKKIFCLPNTVLNDMLHPHLQPTYHHQDSDSGEKGLNGAWLAWRQSEMNATLIKCKTLASDEMMIRSRLDYYH